MIRQASFFPLLGALLLLPAPSIVSSATIELNIGFEGAGTIIIQREVESVQEIKQRNIVMQERDYSCGSAALATLFNYFIQRPVTEREIITTLLDLNRTKGTLEKVVERKGFSLLDLKQFAESRNLKAQGFKLDYDDLVGLGMPAIVPIIPHGYKHFVVFRGVKNGRVFLADPAFGHITQSEEEFKRDWYGFTNVALVIYPPGEHRPASHPMSLSELDHFYIGQENLLTFIFRSDSFPPVRQGEF